MADPRPTVLGYLHAPVLRTDQDIERAKALLATYAHREGYTLDTIFIDQPDHTPAAFATLLETADRHNITHLVVPSLAHLHPLGLPPQLIHHLHRITGLHVLIAFP